MTANYFFLLSFSFGKMPVRGSSFSQLHKILQALLRPLVVKRWQQQCKATVTSC